eukprot:403339990
MVEALGSNFKNKRINAFREKLQTQELKKLSIPKFGNNAGAGQNGLSKLDSDLNGKGDLFNMQGDSFGMNDLASHVTLPSDSSPFREKYEIDEDGELLGEPNSIKPNIMDSHINAFKNQLKYLTLRYLNFKAILLLQPFYISYLKHEDL